MALTRATEHCREGREMSGLETEDLVAGLIDLTTSDEVKVAFLTAWAEKGETAGELAGMARAFLARAKSAGVTGRWGGKGLADCCGTGGGGRPIVNISTAAGIVAAAAGLPVAKHGNRGVTRPSGSADVLTALGVRGAKDAGELASCLGEVGCAFLYAPDFHPAFRGVAGARKILSAQGKRTAFHLLGPLVNPARPEIRMVGVFREEDMGKLAEAMDCLGVESYAILYGEDEKGAPLGELSPLGRNRLMGKKGGEKFDLMEESSSGDWGSSLDLEAPKAEESAAKIRAVLAGDGARAVRGAVVWNAGALLWLGGVAKNWVEGRKVAEETIAKGSARALLERWRTWSRD
ncbi:MAG: anthranilate phosphoribosyltransferase [Candidatus Pacebacteria bacterium]|nr:anthranilate phosphoribosyltransferase [Candidatus Paceibacterota bacterium]